MQAVQRKGILKRVQIKSKGLLEISSKTLLSVLKKILFWLLSLNAALKMCSSMSTLQQKGVWSPQAELPAVQAVQLDFLHQYLLPCIIL